MLLNCENSLINPPDWEVVHPLSDWEVVHPLSDWEVVHLPSYWEVFIHFQIGRLFIYL